MTEPSLPALCPCGTGARYDACCGPLHQGRRAGGPTAPTAERLMRSRYSAFAIGDADYIAETWHPSTRPATVELDQQTEWRGLEIIGATEGDEADRTGTVEFVAHYWDGADRARGELRERSAFRRSFGQWFYVGEAD